MFKKNWDKIREDKMLEMLKNIVTFFNVGEEDDNEAEFETSKQWIGMKQLFRGQVKRLETSGFQLHKVCGFK